MIAVLVITALFIQPAFSASDSATVFKPIPLQYIAALGDPAAAAGDGAQKWGIWRKDPGPRGVWLQQYDKLSETGGVTPANWTFDEADWWVDENGLLMEKPTFPLPPGKYLVTGDREMITVLTIHPSDEDGNRRWDLERNATLYDVTHLPCRSARYTPTSSKTPCTPASAALENFPVAPGGAMPHITGCNKQDYAVLFVIAVAVDN